MAMHSTKWPLFELYFRIWRFYLGSVLMTQSPESMSYQYVMLIIRWGSKELFTLKLYDTERRIHNRFYPLLHEPYNIKELRNIKKIANEEIKRLLR